MKEKPKMYQGKIDKTIHNNMSIVYMSNNKNSTFDVHKANDIRKKIDGIINSSSFIYRTRVNIVLESGIISRKIIGILNNNLVTIDNENIPIANIKDIYK